MYPRDPYQPHDPARPGGRALIWLIAPLGRATQPAGGSAPRHDPLPPHPTRWRPSLRTRMRGVGRDLLLLCLSLMFVAAMIIYPAETFSPVQALGDALAPMTAFGAVITVYGLYRGGEQLRRRYREWTGDQLCESLAWIGFGLVTIAAAQVLRLLSSTGQIPLP